MMYPALDAATIRISRHAVDRYLEHRGWNTFDQIARLEAEYCIREILGRAAGKQPPLYMRMGAKPTRRWHIGNMAWITNADNDVLITMYPLASTASRQAKKSAQLRRRMARQESFA